MGTTTTSGKSSTPGDPQLTVLVVDDREAHAQGLAELLGMSGFRSMYALTGNDGLRAARAENIDAVLLDLNLPDMSGYEVCTALRDNPRTKNIAIIFHTAEHSMNQSAEADAFLTYPISTEHMCTVIRGCVAKRAGRR